MNKGILLATGNIVVDNFFADEAVLSGIATAFEKHNPGVLYGDLDYINENGWMPLQPTFYCGLNLFKKFGLCSLDYGKQLTMNCFLDFCLLKRYRLSI